MSSWAISDNGEDYEGYYSTKEEAIQAGLEEANDELEEFYVGEAYEPEIEFVDGDVIAEHVIDRIQEHLNDEGGEFAENFSVTDEQIGQLEILLTETVKQWIEDCELKPGFSLIKNIETIRIKPPVSAT